ncbi:MAG: excinuclease ABC subunit UvrA [Phycisphaeraceae bacterium]
MPTDNASYPVIAIRGAREHNLKHIDIDIPRDQLVVITGLSGSGKSTLAFDTIYAEGQRKYMESLSAYARQFLDQLQKPDVESIEGLPPTIAIEQRSASHNPRSTVATTTEIYDYLRLLLARAGEARCWHRDSPDDPACGHPIAMQSATQIVDHAMNLADGTRLMALAPVIRGKKGQHKEVFASLLRQGFVRARVDGEVMDLREITESKDGTPFVTKTSRYQAHSIDAVVDRIVIRKSDEEAETTTRTRLADSIELSLGLAEGLVILSVETPDLTGGAEGVGGVGGAGGWEDALFSEKHACPIHPECSLEALEPRLFSFNSPYGACPTCNGLGNILEFDPDLIVPDQTLSLADGAIQPWRKNGVRMNIYYSRTTRRFCKDFDVDIDTPFNKLPKAIRGILMNGTTPKDEEKYDTHFEGVVPNLQRRWETTDSEFVKSRLHSYQSEKPCQICRGGRLRTEAMHVFLHASPEAGQVGSFGTDENTFINPGDPPAKPRRLINIQDVVAMTIDEASGFFEHLILNREQTAIAEPILKEIRSRLGFMMSVGLNYLSLSRTTGTLSGGESQRIRLATQVGSGLVGCCYVLDEPTIGLHQRDNDRLIATLRRLTSIGNTVLVVEHDEDTIRSADRLIDIGPGPGRHGGQIVSQGTPDEVAADPNSLTGQYLAGTREIPTPEERRVLSTTTDAITVYGASENNLKTIDVAFPLHGLVVVTGVSGSGKSTLVNEIFLKGVKREVLGSRDKPGAHKRIKGADKVERIIEVDQSPIGRTPRSNPATYTGVFDAIRNLFTQTREAKARGYKPGRFSFNVKGGRCEACQGQGVKRIEMHFLPDVFVPCETCKGARYNRETLEIKYRGKHIADVLDMTIEDALAFFDAFPDVKRLLTALNDVGLSYLQLGQASTTLSGGEAQRVKLATELGKRPNGHTLYVLDEPTTGLHFADVERLLHVLQTIADDGHTVLVIEHNLDIIKAADHIIDLGPEGGAAGGTIIATGTPEEVAENPESYTGQYLAKVLYGEEAIA